MCIQRQIYYSQIIDILKLFACVEQVRRDAELYGFYVIRAYFRNAEDGVPYY